MVFIVGLAGPAKVGKSTTAKAAVASFKKQYPGLKVDRYAFATPIYEIVSYITGWDIDKLKDLKYKEEIWTAETAPFPTLIGYSPRILLQKIGTECFRNIIGSNFWVDLTIKKVQHLDIVIIEDARFENEFKVCDLLVEIERSEIKYEMNHPSAMPPDPKYINAKLKIDSPEYDIDKCVFWLVQQLLKRENKNAV